MNAHINAQTPRESAQIVPFPVGGRAGLASRRQEPLTSEVLNVSPRVMIGSWYHEEAIKEDSGRSN